MCDIQPNYGDYGDVSLSELIDEGGKYVFVCRGRRLMICVEDHPMRFQLGSMRGVDHRSWRRSLATSDPVTVSNSSLRMEENRLSPNGAADNTGEKEIAKRRSSGSTPDPSLPEKPAGTPSV